MYFSKFNDVYFVEGLPANAIVLKNISTVIDGFFRNAQLKTLDDVKRIMAEQVKAEGGNAVVDFKYGQRSGGILRCLFSLDDVCWTGEGKIANINPADLHE